MAAQIDLNKCTMCGGYSSTICVERSADSAIRVQDGLPVVTEAAVKTAMSAQGLPGQSHHHPASPDHLSSS